MPRSTTANRHGSKWIWPATRRRIYARDGHACVYCTWHKDRGAKLTLDHLKSRNRGGSNAPSNLVTRCHKCNSERGARSLRAWYRWLTINGGWSRAARRVRNAIRRKLPEIDAR